MASFERQCDRSWERVEKTLKEECPGTPAVLDDHLCGHMASCTGEAP